MGAGKKQPPTMRDVAELVGVSVQTVSAVVNDKPGITEETRARVHEAISRLGYHPYAVARSLRTRQTRTLALVVSDIANPSFATMASAAEDYAHGFGYSVIVYNTHDDAQREASYIRSIAQNWIDGVLFVSAGDMTGLDAIEASSIPFVAIDRIPEHYTGPSVTLDNIAAGRIAADHLLDLGHRRLTHISGPMHLRLARERVAGFAQAVRARGLEPGGWPPPEGDWTCESGYRIARALLGADPRPTALYAANDRMAIGAMQAAYELGLRVPADLAIVGTDDIEVAAYQAPPLTTIYQPFADFGTQAIRLLLERITTGQIGEPNLVTAPRLLIRQSTAPPRDAH